MENDETMNNDYRFMAGGEGRGLEREKKRVVCDCML